ncbi:hypothetical protein EON67_10655, partial [archaeon]
MQVTCEPGTYSTGSAQVCTMCPAGSACPSTTAAGSTCAAGQFSYGTCLLRVCWRHVARTFLAAATGMLHRLVLPPRSVQVVPRRAQHALLAGRVPTRRAPASSCACQASIRMLAPRRAQRAP